MVVTSLVYMVDVVMLVIVNGGLLMVVSLWLWYAW